MCLIVYYTVTVGSDFRWNGAIELNNRLKPARDCV